MLALSLPALDLVAHEFGPRSHEVQDVLMRADVLIGRLLEQLDARVGPGNYVVAFSSDHGVATMPERLVAEGKDAGRVCTTEIRNAVNAVVGKLLGATGTVTYVVTVYEQQVVLTAGTMDKLRALPGALDAVKNAIKTAKGIAAAYSVDEIASSAPTTDPFIRQWRLSLVRDRAGDFMFVPRADVDRASAARARRTARPYELRPAGAADPVWRACEAGTLRVGGVARRHRPDVRVVHARQPRSRHRARSCRKRSGGDRSMPAQATRKLSGFARRVVLAVRQDPSGPGGDIR